MPQLLYSFKRNHFPILINKKVRIYTKRQEYIKRYKSKEKHKTICIYNYLKIENFLCKTYKREI